MSEPEQNIATIRTPTDIRLPTSEDTLEEMRDEYEYALHSAAKEEEELAQELGENPWEMQQEFEKIVTSGVESRALINDAVPDKLTTIYPVSLVADPTSKEHYYVVSLASENAGSNITPREESRVHYNTDQTIGEGASQRSWTDYPDKWGHDHASKRGRPNYGSNYRIVVKKMSIESNLDPIELTDAEKVLASTSHSGKLIAMRHEWMQEFEPDLGEDVRPSGLLFAPSGDANGVGDVLVMVGTTAGRGSAFGTMSAETRQNEATDNSDGDLDGFVMKMHTDTGNFAGHNTFDSTTNQFLNMHSLRIKSNPGQHDVVSSVCATPLKSVGPQEEMTHIYVVGSTSAVLPGHDDELRSAEFLAKYPDKIADDSGRADAMEAFLMKVQLSTMEIVWTVQVGAFVPDTSLRGNSFGYGCAVTPDGEEVYLSGLVKEKGVVTDFSAKDFSERDADHGFFKAEGGTDIFLSSYKTLDGSRILLRQVGSTRDDYPSRGNGGITTDRFGNAILTGSTRGSLMRKRSDDEYKYGRSGKDAASDVFVMSFGRATALNHVPIASGGVQAPAPQPTTSVSPPTVSEPAPISQEEIDTKNGALVGVVAIALAFILIAAGTYALVVHRIKVQRNKERDTLMSTNLHDSRRGESSSLPGRRRSLFAPRNSATTGIQKDFDDLNIMVEVRNSASGGWHGVYDDEQLQAIDFGVPSGSGSDDVVEQSLFMEDGLKEIEESMGSYEIGDMDDVSDEDLIKAYNDAMAQDIEPESPDVEFAMAGLGSGPMLDDVDIPVVDDPKITGKRHSRSESGNLHQII